MGRGGDDPDYDGERKSKRQRVLHQISESSRISYRVLQAFYDSQSGKAGAALFSVPPCEIQEPQFRLRYGLVQICANRMPSYDKFRAVECSDQTLSRIDRLVRNDIVYSSEFQVGDNGETQVAPILDRLLRNLGRFTRPLPRQEEEASYETSQAETVVKKSSFGIKYVDSDSSEEVLSSEEDEALTNSQSSDSSQDVMGVAPFNSSFAAPRHHSDAKIYVYCSRHTIRGLKLKIVKDWKTKASIQALFQPAVYSIQELEETAAFSKEYRPPIVGMAADKDSWYYSIVEIDGFIKVKNQEIEPASLEAFPENPTAVNPKKFTRSFTRREIVAMFATWKRELALKDIKVPNGLHPVGRFFYRTKQEYHMPSLNVGDQLDMGQKRYYDGMLKTVVGRKVVKWTPADALEAWNARKRYLELDI